MGFVTKLYGVPAQVQEIPVRFYLLSQILKRVKQKTQVMRERVCALEAIQPRFEGLLYGLLGMETEDAVVTKACESDMLDRALRSLLAVASNSCASS